MRMCQEYEPFPTLLVNLVRLSETPKTVFFTKLAAPYRIVSIGIIEKMIFHTFAIPSGKSWFPRMMTPLKGS